MLKHRAYMTKGAESWANSEACAVHQYNGTGDTLGRPSAGTCSTDVRDNRPRRDYTQ